jgi:hypothetical protein
MEVPVLVDGRNLFDPRAVREAGFEYISIGRDGAAHTSPGSSPAAAFAQGAARSILK